MINQSVYIVRYSPSYRVFLGYNGIVTLSVAKSRYSVIYGLIWHILTLMLEERTAGRLGICTFGAEIADYSFIVIDTYRDFLCLTLL